jgi:hypothetical protein
MQSSEILGQIGIAPECFIRAVEGKGLSSILKGGASQWKREEKLRAPPKVKQEHPNVANKKGLWLEVFCPEESCLLWFS